MKRSTAIALLATTLLGLASLTPAHAATRPTSVAGCTKSTAKGHTPATVKQPTVAAKNPANTLTITTNCGDIVIALLGAKAPITVLSQHLQTLVTTTTLSAIV